MSHEVEFQQMLSGMDEATISTEQEAAALAGGSDSRELSISSRGSSKNVRHIPNTNRGDTLSRNHPFFKLLLSRKSSRPQSEDKIQNASMGLPLSPVHTPSKLHDDESGAAVISRRPKSRSGSARMHLSHQGSSGGISTSPSQQSKEAPSDTSSSGSRNGEMFGMQRIVLKFTTVSEGSEPSAFIVDRSGARIGRGAENKVSIPSDTTMRLREHARIDYDETEKAFRLVDLGNRHGAAIRIPVGSGVRDWPLKESSAFSAGNSVFVVSSIDMASRISSSKPESALSGEATEEAAEGQECEPALFLEVTSGPLRGERRRIGREGASLGRATDNLISIADKELSRRHSLVEYDEKLKGYFLCDVGSTNGTYMQLVGPYANSYKLTFSDHILVGRTGFSINRFDYGVSEEIGRRPNMEDKSIVIQDLGIEHFYKLGLGPQSFVAVYDGHGGPHASNYLWRHLHINVSECLENLGKVLLEAYPDGSGTISDEILDESINRTVTECFLRTDEHYITTSDNPQCGSTATVGLIIANRFYNFNVGDSRTVLCRGGKVRMVSKDHKPSREDETERIKKAGGFVIHKRVMGELAVSRAFGDKEFKMGLPAMLQDEQPQSEIQSDSGNTDQMPSQPFVTAEPENLVMILDPEDDFIILACDGLFDVLTTEEVAELVHQELIQHGDTQRSVEMLSHVAIHKRRTRDNVTVVLVALRKWW